MMIGIIGNGFVGDAVYQGMKDHYEVLVHDVNPQKSLNDLSEINEVKNIFLCVPTPMALEGGIDISIIKDVAFALEPNKNIVVKSTITPQAAKEIIDLFRLLKSNKGYSRYFNEFKNILFPVSYHPAYPFE